MRERHWHGERRGIRWWSGLGSALAAVALLPLALAAPRAQAAACASSTPANATYTEPTGGTGAPDVDGVTLTLDAACNLEISFGVANRPSGLEGGDDLQLQLDTDGNAATGQPTSIDPDYLSGADLRLDIGSAGATVAPFAGPVFGEFTPPTSVPKVGQFAARVPLALVPTVSGATLQAWGNSCSPMTVPCSDDYFPALDSSFTGRVATYALPLVFTAAAPPSESLPSTPPPSPGTPTPPTSRRPAPTNAFRLGKPKLNKKKGTARLSARIPGPGRLVLAGKAVKRQVKHVPRAGRVTLTVKAKGKAARQLRRRGVARIRVKVTFTPTGGKPRAKAKALRLAKARP